MFNAFNQINSTPTPLITVKRPDTFNVRDNESAAAAVDLFSAESPYTVYVGAVGLEPSSHDDILLETGERILFEEMAEHPAAVVTLFSAASPRPFPVDGGGESVGANVDFISAFSPVQVPLDGGGESGGANVDFISAFSPVQISFAIPGDNAAATVTLTSAASP